MSQIDEDAAMFENEYRVPARSTPDVRNDLRNAEDKYYCFPSERQLLETKAQTKTTTSTSTSDKTGRTSPVFPSSSVTSSVPSSGPSPMQIDGMDKMDKMDNTDRREAKKFDNDLLADKIDQHDDEMNYYDVDSKDEKIATLNEAGLKSRINTLYERFVTNRTLAKAALSMSLYDQFTEPKIPPELKVLETDNNVVLARYSFHLLEENSVREIKIRTVYNFYIKQVLILFTLCRRHGLIQSETDEYAKKLRSISEMIYYYHELLVADARVNQLRDPLQSHVDVSEESKQFRFAWHLGSVPISKLSPWQKLLQYCLHEASKLNLRKKGEHIYCEEVQCLDDGDFFTRAWHRQSSIQEFVAACCRSDKNMQQWYNATSGSGNIKHAAEYLQTCMEPELPQLRVSRHVFSFRNGVYHCKQGPIGMFYPFRPPVGSSLSPPPRTLASCKFFKNQDFPAHYLEIPNIHQDWYEKISTPHFQSIFDAQELPKEAIRWIYCFFGRLLYNLNDPDLKEHWETILFVKGVAGSGKSTLLNVYREFYNKEDVAVLASSCEQMFGAQTLLDKYGWACYEVKRRFNLDQGLLQSIITGEEVTIPIKHKPAKTLVWQAPGIMSGNEAADWKDAAGSMGRRFLNVAFNKRPKNGNPRLMDYLKTEVPTIMLKCNLAYRDMVERYGHKILVNVLPEYFKVTQAGFQETVSSLFGFIVNHCERAPNLEIVEADFIDIFRRYCQRTGNSFPTWNKDVYEAIFSELNIRREEREQTPGLLGATDTEGDGGYTDPDPDSVVLHKVMCLIGVKPKERLTKIEERHIARGARWSS
jgi:hypothetical protein